MAEMEDAMASGLHGDGYAVGKRGDREVVRRLERRFREEPGLGLEGDVVVLIGLGSRTSSGSAWDQERARARLGSSAMEERPETAVVTCCGLGKLDMDLAESCHGYELIEVSGFVVNGCSELVKKVKVARHGFAVGLGRDSGDW
ncbi:hypothetical protein M0R45_036227 [Rubus argutus]|uniref:Uncharacterized protein n=1 Tax=Rubus argutus TaxID=59490 RepID=A0AAW1VWX3_RUBAR